jgi:hypothetical protein
VEQAADENLQMGRGKYQQGRDALPVKAQA